MGAYLTQCLRSSVFLLGMFWALSAQAIFPESGWWWNPAESGRGFNIEIQNNNLFVATFVYEADGTAVWYTSGGTMTGDRSYSGELRKYSGGQCFGCLFQSPSFVTVGSISIQFSDAQSGTLTALGQTTAIQRFDFWKNLAVPDALYGEWSTTEGEPSFPIYFGERIGFSGPYTSTSSGVTYASGHRTGDSAARMALGTYQPSLGKWLVLLDSSTSYYRAYLFSFAGFNRIEGTTVTYLKTANPPPVPVTYFVGHRTKSHARVLTGVGPGVNKSTVQGDSIQPLDMDAMNFQRAKLMAGSPGTAFDAQVVESFTLLKGLLEVARIESAASSFNGDAK